MLIARANPWLCLGVAFVWLGFVAFAPQPPPGAHQALPSLPQIVVSSLIQFVLLFSATFVTAATVPWSRDDGRDGFAARGWHVLRTDLFATPRLSAGRVLRAGLLTGLALTVISGALSIIVEFLTEAAGHEIELQQIVDVFQRSGWHAKAFLFVSAALCSPIFEEVFFRYALESVLAGATGSANRALAYTAVLFAAMHGNLAVMPSLMAVSVGCSLVYRRTGSLAASIAAHFLFNLVSLALILAGVSS